MSRWPLPAPSAAHLRRAWRDLILGALVALVLALITSLGAVLPGGSQPLSWYLPVLDCAMAVTLLVVLVLSAADVLLRRNGALLPVSVGSLALALTWLAHGLTFPRVLPTPLPLTSSETAAYLFHLGHLGTAALIAWALLHRAAVIHRPRRIVTGALAGSLVVSGAVIVAVAILARFFPPLIVGDQFTDLN